MHMANELLSVPVAVGTLALAAGGLGFVCRKVKATITTERWAVMGIMGATHTATWDIMDTLCEHQARYNRYL